jgi:hypothetical protein
MLKIKLEDDAVDYWMDVVKKRPKVARELITANIHY